MQSVIASQDIQTGDTYIDSEEGACRVIEVWRTSLTVALTLRTISTNLGWRKVLTRDTACKVDRDIAGARV